MTVNAIIARNPGVIARRRDARDPSPRRPMLGCPMTGDPRFEDKGPTALMIRRACQYAAAMAARDGLVPADLSGVDANFSPPATIIFVRADASQADIGRWTVPEHVMSYDPTLAVVGMEDAP
jgi:hypothetical protein